MNKRFITKDDSKKIYGIAILLMIFHHLFGFPDRIHVPYTAFILYKGVPVVTILAGAARICISLYAFISGYGLVSKVSEQKELATIKSNYKMIIKQIKKFYLTYWIVFIPFIAFGFIIGYYKFNYIELLKNFIGLSCSYNAEWWYVKQYMLMLLLFPLLYYLIDGLSSKVKLDHKSILIVFIIESVIIRLFTLSSFFIYLFCFINGMLISFYKVDKILFELKSSLSLVINLPLVLLVVIIRLTVLGKGSYDFFLGPLFIYICLMLLDAFNNKCLDRLLQCFGKYSIYMWLVHTFFIYYYFQKYIFIPNYVILVYPFIVIICYFIAMIFDLINHFTIITCKKVIQIQ